MKKFSFLILVLIFSTQSVFAQDKSLHDKIENSVKDYTSKHFLNATYMFVKGNKTLEVGAHGMRSFKTKAPLKANDQMPVASITKSMTAAGILKLQDKKLLNVSDAVSKHIDSKSGIWKDNKVPAWANEVTIHDLLTHRSGLTEYFMNIKIDLKESHKQINKDIANFAGSRGLQFKPGSKFVYNNSNFVILGLIIEQVSGEDLADFYKKELFAPIGMKSSRLLSLEEAVKSQTDPDHTSFPVRYFVTPNGTKNPVINEAKSEFIMVPFADGGVVSTTADLIKWHRALHDGKVLSKESYELMTKKHYKILDKSGMDTYMGYGLFISTLWEGCDSYYHAGNALAIRGESGYVPSQDLYYAVLSNIMSYVPKDMADKIDMNLPENQIDIFFFVKNVLEALK